MTLILRLGANCIMTLVAIRLYLHQSGHTNRWKTKGFSTCKPRLLHTIHRQLNGVQCMRNITWGHKIHMEKNFPIVSLLHSPISVLFLPPHYNWDLSVEAKQTRTRFFFIIIWVSFDVTAWKTTHRACAYDFWEY